MDGIRTVVVGDVGRDATGAGIGTGVLQNFAKELGGGGQVAIPAEPATMGGIKVEVDILVLQLANCVGDAFLVGGGSIGTFLDVHVGDNVAKGVGLENDGECEASSFRVGQLLGDI